jgi:hypothetical protein
VSAIAVRRGRSHGRLHRTRGLLAFLGGFFVLMIVGGAISAALAPKTKALCVPYRPCGAPPRTVQGVISESVWRSSRYGYTLEYSPQEMAIAEHDPGGLILAPHLNGTAAIVIDGFPASQVSASSAIPRQLGELRGLSGAAADPDPAHELLGASVGYHAGVGRTEVGNLNAPQGPGQPVQMASEAAQHGALVVAVTVIASPKSSGPSSGLYQLADQVVNSVKWPGA